MRRSPLARLLLPTALACALTPALATAQPADGALALDNVHIVEAEHNRVSARSCVRVQDARIATIAAAGAPACLEGARAVDLQGRYLVPGLIDMHAHLTLGPLEIKRERGRAVMQALPDDDIAEHNARRLVAFGVTTVRNPGGDLPAAARYKARLAASELVGPEAFNAGPVINNADLPGLSIAAHSAEDMDQVVRAQVEAGADWIKLYTGLSPELLQAGIDAAHRHGRPAVAHLESIAWPDALAMGLDGIVHLMPLSPDLLTPEQRAAWQATARGGTYSFFEWWEHFDPEGPQAERLVAAYREHRPVFDATLVAFHAAFVQDQDNPYKDDARRHAHPRLLDHWNEWFTFAIGWEPEDFERARAVWPKVQRMAARLYATDARMTLGTDMSNPWIAPGISLHRELQLLAEAGVPNAALLLAATRNAAEALGAGQRLGRVAPGFEADLLVLDADPLQDIRHTRDIHAVVLDGEILTTTALNQLKGE
ncbi:amidohydrolase family protein [Luteimonas sp. SJ-92]|uniref:Amidohydrolase family protein n=1 Tax=Luteimonas salinisoli TaxID=2752307 RepID=A0A853J9V9_9GAMM|nr:amidohydrolase family protein [Luteimonas salinisoli]NZA25458.1 amidohydrolase family protein [Luteimonas salinisoli]